MTKRNDANQPPPDAHDLPPPAGGAGPELAGGSSTPPPPYHSSNAIAPPSAARKKRRGLFWGLICGGIALFALLAVLGHFFLGNWLTSDFTLTDEQKAVLFTADDFARWSGEWQPANTAQTVFTGLRYFDGSMELDYEFQDDADYEAPYIYSLVTIERNAFEARSAYAGQKVGERIGSWLEDGGEDDDVKVVQSNAVFSCGDKSEYAIYTAGDGEAYGAQLHALSGNKVVFIVITGSFDPADPNEVSALLTPALERLKAYSPKPARK